MDDLVHLFFQSNVAVNRGVEIIGFINANPRAFKPGFNNVLQDGFQRLSVLLIHGKQKERKHDHDHDHGREARTQSTLHKEEHRYAYQRTDAKANDLTLGQAEEKLGFNLGQVFGNRHICHIIHSNLIVIYSQISGH